MTLRVHDKFVVMVDFSKIRDTHSLWLFTYDRLCKIVSIKSEKARALVLRFLFSKDENGSYIFF